jgi:tRNA A22 N-methylase
MFFTKNFYQNLHKYALKVTKNKSKNNFEEEMNKTEQAIAAICHKRKILSNNELNFIFDFLLEMCQNAQTFEAHSIGIGTHLISEFYEKSHKQFERSILQPKHRITAELLAINFEMRSKKFIEEVNQ